MELVNTHTHAGYTGHGFGTLQELADAASAANISTLAFTEHYPLDSTLDPDHHVSMPYDGVPRYIADGLEARSAHPDMEILIGCEVDWLGKSETRVFKDDEFESFDLVLGSVHYLDLWAFDNPNLLEKWDEISVDEVYRRYFEEWMRAASSDFPFHVMSHPDLCKKFGHRPSVDPVKWYEAAAETCRDAGRMIEVNTSGAFYPCKEMYPAPDFLRVFARVGVACTVGTDAHRAEHVARGIEQAYRLMYECGYRKLTVPVRNGDRRVIALS